MAGKGGARPGSGRKQFRPTAKERTQVEALAGYGLRIQDIGALVREGIDEKTLRKYFDAELVRGRAKANARIGQTLYQKATGGDTASLIWWTKSQMGWKETQTVEHTSPDGTMTPKVLDPATIKAIAKQLDDEC